MRSGLKRRLPAPPSATTAAAIGYRLRRSGVELRAGPRRPFDSSSTMRRSPGTMQSTDGSAFRGEISTTL